MYTLRINPFLYFSLLLAGIAYGSLNPGDARENMQILDFENADKLIHGFMYFLLTLSLAYAMMKKNVFFRQWKVNLAVIGGPALYGMLMEMLQYFLTQDRKGDPLDMLANSIGIALAFMLSYKFTHMHKNNMKH